MKNCNLAFYLYNWLSFYIYWYICFWGAKNGQFYIGPLIGSGFIFIHLLLITNIWREIKYILICILIGPSLDFILTNLNIIEYNGQFLFNQISFPPIWILTLWAGFGTTIFHSFKWLHGRYMITSFLGCIFFPFIYYSGHYYGSIKLVISIENYLLISILGSCIFLLLIIIADKMKIK